MYEADQLWTACSEVLRQQVSEAVWLTSFNGVVPVGRTERELVVAVPSSVVKDRIESRYLTLVQGALADIGQADIALVIEVRTDADDAAAPVLAFEDSPSVSTVVPDGAPPDFVDPPGREVEPGRANQRYTFEDFVTGTSNRFAHAASLAVAEEPAKSYNPLFIYGDSGLGKTHLLQAIARYVRQHYPTYLVRYLSTETFLNQFVYAIRTNTMAEFKTRYREVDVLLLDDIQFIEGKEGIQEELFHTFNDLHQANRQIVLSSDRPPDAISTLEDRLRGRFKMGLITDIQPPDLETRLAILRRKADREDMHVPDDVLELIGTHVKNNIRELEGALNRVCAYATLNREALTVDIAERVLADVLADNQPRPITPELILQRTSEMFGFPIEEITGKSRRRPLVTARQISMYVFRESTDMSYPMIAREFGGRDHTTVIHAVAKINREMKERRQIYDQVAELTQNVRSGG